MPNIKQQIKRMRKAERQRMRNRAIKSRLKTEIKKFRIALESGDKEAAVQAYRVAARALDKAVTKGVIHKNKAANKKSRMSGALNKMAENAEKLSA